MAKAQHLLQVTQTLELETLRLVKLTEAHEQQAAQMVDAVARKKGSNRV